MSVLNPVASSATGLGIRVGFRGGGVASSSINAYLDNADTGGKLGETIEPYHGDMALHRLVRDQQVFGKPSNRDGQCARGPSAAQRSSECGS